MDKHFYDRQRRANLLLAHADPARLTARQIATLADARRPLAMADGGMLMGADTTGLEVSVVVRMRQVPTSFVHLLDPRATPLVTFRVHNGRDTKVRLRMTTRVARLSAEAIDTIEVAPGADATNDQLPVFFADRIAEVTEARAASVLVRIEDLDGEIERESSHRIVLLPRTTAYLAVDDGGGGALDLTRYLAAWVTPNAFEVMQLIREAAALHPKKTIAGYQLDGAASMADSVRAQVKAVFRALKARHIVYVSSTAAFNFAGEAFVQRIRLPSEALRDRSANCIDGVVLMASALEAASLDAAIALVPGHAFVGYATEPGSACWEFVETTMIGTAKFNEARAAAETLAISARDAGGLRVLSIPKLRTEDQVFPME